MVSRFHFKIDAKRTGGIPFMREKLVSRPLLALFALSQVSKLSSFHEFNEIPINRGEKKKGAWCPTDCRILAATIFRPRFR